jgi:ABC-type glycerol-3-phosphate transport system substrate-binding protein
VIPRPAADWNELAAGARFAARGETPRAGLALAGAPGMPALAGFLPFLLSYGGVLLDEGWQAGFAGGQGIGALVRMLGLLRFLPEDAEDADEQRAAADLLDGRAVTVIARAELGARAGDAPGALVGADMAALLAAVPTNPANPRGGRALVRWLASPEAQVSLARAGAPPASREAIADDTARARHPWLDGLATTAPIALAPARLPDIGKVSEVVGTRIHDAILRAQATRRDFVLIATEALRAAASEIETYLTRQGGYYS